MFICPIYYHNWWNISTIYIYIYIKRLASNEIFSPLNKIHQEAGWAKDLSALLYVRERDCGLGCTGLGQANTVVRFCGHSDGISQ